MGERRKLFQRLLDCLAPQVAKYNGDIQVLVHDNEKATVGQKRQQCLDVARGEYVNFVDDDDLVADNYCDSIYPLLDGVDYIGFHLQLWVDDEKRPPTYHSLKYGHWFETDQAYYRTVSHLNPIKRTLAIEGVFDGEWGEDKKWADQVGPFVKTEHYIPDLMYYYLHSPEQSLTGISRRPKHLGLPRLQLPEHFSYY